jgi:hypothetical protein
MNTEPSVEQELKEMSSPLAGLSKEMPYTVPENYFLGLADDALKSAKRQAVPAGYFEVLPAAMLKAAKAVDAESAGMKRRTKLVALSAMRWAAAAILIIAVAIGGAKLYQGAQSPERVIAALPTDAVHAYAEVNLADETVAMTETADLAGLTAEELEAYLAENGWVE